MNPVLETTEHILPKCKDVAIDPNGVIEASKQVKIKHLYSF
jgi:hypothetical protein